MRPSGDDSIWKVNRKRSPAGEGRRGSDSRPPGEGRRGATVPCGEGRRGPRSRGRAVAGGTGMPQQKHQDESQRGVESRLQTPEGLGHQQGPETGRPPAGAGRDHPLGERGAGSGSRRAPRRPRGDRCRPRGAVRSASGARGRLARAPGGRVCVARAVDVRRQQQTPPGAHASVPRPSRCACAEAGHQRGHAGGRGREPGRPARGRTSRIAGAVLQAGHSRARTRVLSSAEKLGGLQEHPLPSRRPGGDAHALPAAQSRARTAPPAPR